MTAGTRYATKIGIQDVIGFSFRLLPATSQRSWINLSRPCNFIHDVFHPASRRHEGYATSIHLRQQSFCGGIDKN